MSKEEKKDRNAAGLEIPCSTKDRMRQEGGSREEEQGHRQ